MKKYTDKPRPMRDVLASMRWHLANNTVNASVFQDLVAEAEDALKHHVQELRALLKELKE
jgi:hypothetical protein